MAYVGPARRRQGVYCHEHWTTVGYPLLSSQYDYVVQDIAVFATLSETYQAQTNVERQVSYIFEVPPEASVVNFSAQVGDTKITSMVDEKEGANEKYQQATRAGIQAWKLDKVNDEVFQISLGNASPNSTITVRVNYAYLISSDTIEDSVRLTIPAGLAARPGAGPASQTTVPTAPTGANAVTITVGIDVQNGAQILDLACLSHRADITNGFSDNSFKGLTPVQKQKKYSNSKAYVEFTSSQFLHHHFVLVWAVPRIDHARCLVEQLPPPVAGKPQTAAFALTLVSNIELDPEEHEYIFLVDSSGSMHGSRAQTANDVIKAMLAQLPTAKKSSFNIYRFNTSAWSILSGQRSLGYDTKNVGTAVGLVGTYASGGTNINMALTTILGQRDASKPRCSVIVITDGLDWGVAAAMQTVQKNVVAASAQSKLLRVFVMGLGDDVSRGMCEALARAGSGATAYISESQLQERDHQAQKAQTLINSINRAPLRVRSIDWGMAPAPTQLGAASGSNLGSRPTPNQGQLGAAAKGDNVPPPKSIQQAPLPGTIFWAVRSYWYAIIHGNPTSTTPKVKIQYDIPGRANSTKEVEVRVTHVAPGTVFHSLAARALIQTLEDKATSITDPTERYWNECEIVRLGKTHSLASTQTSFVATMNGVGTVTNAASNAAPGDRSALSGAASLGNEFGLHFVSTRGPASPASPASSVGRAAAGFQANGEYARSASAGLYSFGATRGALPSVDSAQGAEGRGILDELLAAQDADGAFEAGAVEQIVFPGTGIPAAPAFVAVLEGRSNVKDHIWLAICVVAFLEKKYADRTSEWSDARAKAEKFVKTTLHCIFGVDSDRADGILADSLDDARGYFC